MRAWRIHVLPADDEDDDGDEKPLPPVPVAAPRPSGVFRNDAGPPGAGDSCAAWPPAVVSGDAPAWRARARWTAWNTYWWIERESRNRTSIFDGCTFTSTASGGRSRNSTYEG